MKAKILVAILLFPFLKVSGSGNGYDKILPVSPEMKAITGNTFILEYQLFESRDQSKIETDTISHPGDSIFFSEEGKAYLNFKGRPDSIDYFFPDAQSVSFGDTPFTITIIGGGFIKLYQEEQEPGGDYNRVSYLLKMEAPL